MITVLFLLCGSVVHNLSLSVFLPCLANKRVRYVAENWDDLLTSPLNPVNPVS